MNTGRQALLEKKKTGGTYYLLYKYTFSYHADFFSFSLDVNILPDKCQLL